MKPIEHMVDAVVSCLKCGTPGIDSCGCWTKCECGWRYESGGECPNEVHRCTYIHPREGRCVWEVQKDGLCKEHRRRPRKR